MIIFVLVTVLLVTVLLVFVMLMIVVHGSIPRCDVQKSGTLREIPRYGGNSLLPIVGQTDLHPEDLFKVLIRCPVGSEKKIHDPFGLRDLVLIQGIEILLLIDLE